MMFLKILKENLGNQTSILHKKTKTFYLQLDKYYEQRGPPTTL